MRRASFVAHEWRIFELLPPRFESPIVLRDRRAMTINAGNV